MKNIQQSDFAWVRTASKNYMGMVEDALRIKRTAIDTIKSIPAGQHTFENTCKALEYADQQVVAIWNQVHLLKNVKVDERDRNAAKAAEDYLQASIIELEYDEEIYQLYAAIAKKKPILKSAADKTLFRDALRNYKRMGFGLPKATRNKIKAKVLQLAAISSEFRKNINEYSDSIFVTRAELEGASENYIKGLKKKGAQYEVSLQYPDYIPFMETVHNAQKRSQLFQKYLQKGGKRNMVVLSRMIKLRDEIAQLLGYKNHAEFVLEPKMAKNSATVFKFLTGLMKAVQKKVVADITQLEGVKGSKVESHDLLYMMNKDRKQQYNVDDEIIREYFPVEVVTKKLFATYEKLFSVTFKKVSYVPTWHKDVTVYAVHDVRTKALKAHFFLDLHPRAGKYGHAAVFPIIPGLKLVDGNYQKPVVGMLCNFAPRLSHDEVETYFHEFGHVVHQVLTTAEYGSQSGTSVQHDFSEAPSQMLENWVWDESMLLSLSGHYKNPRKKMPKDLASNIIASKYHMIGYATMRQLILGTLDMQLHSGGVIKNPATVYGDLVKKYIGIALPKEQIFPAGFGHLDGYDANYYGYMWSKVYAADMFTRFEKEGLLNAKTGSDYRTYILEPGGSQDAIHLITNFLKRKPNNKAFLKEIGL